MPVYKFKCPACLKIVERLCVVGKKEHKSHCDATGKDVMMKRVLSQHIPELIPRPRYRY